MKRIILNPEIIEHKDTKKIFDLLYSKNYKNILLLIGDGVFDATENKSELHESIRKYLTNKDLT